MKTTVRISGLMLILLISGTMAADAQYGRGRTQNAGQVCSTLPGITGEQIGDLTALSEKHRSEMDQLRAEMRATADRDRKSAIWTKMDNLRTSHRNEILGFLTDEQKAAFNEKCPYYRSMGGRGQGNQNAPGNSRGRR